MLEAIVLGALAQISLLLSGLVATWITVPRRIVGGLAGFGAGALISAIAFDLFAQARALSGLELLLWLLLGAGVFIGGDYVIDGRIGHGKKTEAVGIVLGSVGDGI